MPISIWRCLVCDWYQGCRPIGSLAGRIQRSSFGTTVNSGESQSISV
jgi:hypothetical protein